MEQYIPQMFSSERSPQSSRSLQINLKEIQLPLTQLKELQLLLVVPAVGRLAVAIQKIMVYGRQLRYHLLLKLSINWGVPVPRSEQYIPHNIASLERSPQSSTVLHVRLCGTHLPLSHKYSQWLVLHLSPSKPS